MTPNVGRDIAAGDGPAIEPVSPPESSQADARIARDALGSFLQDGLAAVQDSIEHTMALQQEMMDAVSHHVFGDGRSGQPEASAGQMQVLVSALQSDDLIRQHHENLIRALAVMSRVAGEAHGPGSDADPGEGDAASTLRGIWTADLLNALLLDEMRQRFSRTLGPQGGV